MTLLPPVGELSQAPFKIEKAPLPVTAEALQKAVKDFIVEVGIGGNEEGFYQQTLKKIAQATFLKIPGCEFWMSHKDGKVMGYALARVVEDIDNSLTYWVEQGYVHPDLRNGTWLRYGWGEIEKRARQLMCKHLVNVTNKNVKAYLRFLGKDWLEYAAILKKEIGG